jgi:type IV pilus assembly protein PilA
MQDLLQRLRKMRSEKDEAGFTLIELLVVVVIIGILIAIAIPLYLNYENGAKNKSSASDLRGAISAIEQCYTDNNNVYPASVAATTASPIAICTGQKVTLSSGTTMRYDLSGSTYSVVAYQGSAPTSSAGTWYCYNNGTGGAVKTETGTIATGVVTC